MVVFVVVKELEFSDSKLPMSSFSVVRVVCVSLLVLGLNSNSESRLKLGELKSDRLEEEEAAESGLSTSSSILVISS